MPSRSTKYATVSSGAGVYRAWCPRCARSCLGSLAGVTAVVLLSCLPRATGGQRGIAEDGADDALGDTPLAVLPLHVQVVEIGDHVEADPDRGVVVAGESVPAGQTGGPVLAAGLQQQGAQSVPGGPGAGAATERADDGVGVRELAPRPGVVDVRGQDAPQRVVVVPV